MKHNYFSFLLYLSLAIIPISCNDLIDYIKNIRSNSNAGIEIVKNYKPYKAAGIDLSLEELFAKAAGAMGDVSWKAYKSKTSLSRPEISFITVNLKISKFSKKPKTLLVQYIVNSNSKSVEFVTAELDGKPMDKVLLDLTLIGSQFPF